MKQRIAQCRLLRIHIYSGKVNIPCGLALIDGIKAYDIVLIVLSPLPQTTDRYMSTPVPFDSIYRIRFRITEGPEGIVARTPRMNHHFSITPAMYSLKFFRAMSPYSINTVT